MDCPDIRVYLPFLGEHSLDPGIEREVEIHLLLCDECRAEHEANRRVVSTVIGTLADTASASSPDLLPGIRRGIRRKRMQRRFVQGTAAAAAMVMLAIVVQLGGFFGTGLPVEYELTDPGEDYYDYIEEYYLDPSYIALTYADDLSKQETFQVDTQFLLESGYVNVTIENVIETIDSDRIGEFLQLASF